MSLDIQTEKGQVSLEQEQILINSFERNYPDYLTIQTPKDEPSDVDGFIVSKSKNEIVSVFETKCRNATLNQMKNWGNEWLVTYEKIVKGAEVARRLCVSFTGLLYLIDEPIGLVVKIADRDGNFLPKIRIEKTLTQRTINGGEVFRNNAFIDISTSSKFRIV